MRNIDKIIVHCSATPEGKTYRAADIDAWHRKRGFKMIGYHYVVLLDGSMECGRPESMVGAHCTGHNARSIGVCYIGGLKADGKTSADTRTKGSKRSLTRTGAPPETQISASHRPRPSRICGQSLPLLQRGSRICRHLTYAGQ